MIVDIRGTNSFNLGAQLMLYASVSALSGHFTLSAPVQVTDFGLRAQLGLLQTATWSQLPRASFLAGALAPRPLKRAYGVVHPDEIGGVVDASGFSFSDDFSRRRTRGEALYAERWRRRSVPVVMLPQAFGPFNDKAKRDWSKRMIDASRVVFVRDRVSMEYVTSLGVSTELHMCPDFTTALPPADIPRVSSEPFAAIVPNFKLILSGRLTEQEYLELLAGYVHAVRARDLLPTFVVHDRYDGYLANKVSSSLDQEIATLTSENPLVLKATLAQAEFVVASRFHAIVSALSSGVPTLALGWSHKYEELMHDFGVDDWAIPANTSPGAGVEILESDPESAAIRLREAKSDIEGKVSAMWSLTVDTLAGRR